VAVAVAGVAVAVVVAVAVAVAVAVGVGFFCVAFPCKLTVAEFGPLVALLPTAIVPSTFLPGPWGMNSTSTCWLFEPGIVSVPPTGEIADGNIIT